MYFSLVVSAQHMWWLDVDLPSLTMNVECNTVALQAFRHFVEYVNALWDHLIRLGFEVEIFF